MANMSAIYEWSPRWGRRRVLFMIGAGIARARIISMFYVMLTTSLPKHRIDVYAGLCNFFIVIPVLAALLGSGWVMNTLLDNSRMTTVLAGGVFMAIAALLMECPRITCSRVTINAQGACAVGDVRVTPSTTAGSLIYGHTSIRTIPTPRNTSSGTRVGAWA